MKRDAETDHEELERQYNLINQHMRDITDLLSGFSKDQYMFEGQPDLVFLSFYMLVIGKDLNVNDLKLVLDEAYKEYGDKGKFQYAIDQISSPEFRRNPRFIALVENAANKKNVEFKNQIINALPNFIELANARKEVQKQSVTRLVDAFKDNKLPVVVLTQNFVKFFKGMSNYEIKKQFRLIYDLLNQPENRDALPKIKAIFESIAAGGFNASYDKATVGSLEVVLKEIKQKQENSSAIQTEAVDVFSQIINKNKAPPLICLEFLLAAIKYDLTSREMANILTVVASKFSNQTDNHQKFDTVIRPLMMDPASERGKSFATQAAALYEKNNKQVSAEEITKAMRVFLEAHTMINAISPPETTRPVSNSVSPPNTDPSAAHKRRKKNG